MFSFLKKPAGKTLLLKIEGMHCPSCAMNIDGELESIPGVTSARTNYAQSRTEVTFDDKLVKETSLKKAIEQLGYGVDG